MYFLIFSLATSITCVIISFFYVKSINAELKVDIKDLLKKEEGNIIWIIGNTSIVLEAIILAYYIMVKYSKIATGIDK